LAGDERGVHPDRDDPPDAAPLGTPAGGSLSRLATYRTRSQGAAPGGRGSCCRAEGLERR
jgi:hypothetical protein